MRIYFFHLKERNITTCIHMGDVTDRRKYISYKIANDFHWKIYKSFWRDGYCLHIIIGNHDTYYKNTSQINSMEELVGSDKFKIYGSKVVSFDGTPILFFAWINNDNHKSMEDLETIILI